MELSKLFQPILLISIDCFLGVLSFSFQVAFLSTYLLATSYDLAGAGIWCGFIFVATAAVLWSMDGKIDKRILVISPCLSFVCAIILFSLNVAALSDLDKSCPIKSFYNNAYIIIYRCSKEISLDVALMLCGLFAIPVNALLVLHMFGMLQSH